MATDKIFFPAGIKINTTTLWTIAEQSLDQKVEELSLEYAGDWAPNYTGAKKKAPEIAVESHDLVKALDLMTNGNLCVSQAAANVELLYRAGQKAALAYDASAGQHMIYRMQSNSILYWEQISANQDDELKISVRVAPWYNGANEILTQLPSQPLDAPVAGIAPWTLGPIVLNGTKLKGVKSLQWQTGIEIIRESDAGEAVPTAIFVRRAKPKVSFEITDLEHGLDADGTAVNSLITYFRRRRPNKLNYADTDAMHARLYCDQAACGTARWLSVGNDPGRVKCEIAINRVGAHPLFEYESGCAIP